MVERQPWNDGRQSTHAKWVQLRSDSRVGADTEWGSRAMAFVDNGMETYSFHKKQDKYNTKIVWQLNFV